MEVGAGSRSVDRLVRHFDLMITTHTAEKELERLTGESVKLMRAPKHWGTAVFLDATGKQRIAALWANFGELIGWRLPDRDVSLSNV